MTSDNTDQNVQELANAAEKSADAVKHGAKATKEGVKLGYKGAKNGAKAAKKGAKAGKAAGKGIAHFLKWAISGLVSLLGPELLIAIVAITLVITIIISMLGLKVVDEALSLSNVTDEGQQITLLFKGYLNTKYATEEEKTIFNKIEKRGYTSCLCAIWKVLYVDTYMMNCTQFYTSEQRENEDNIKAMNQTYKNYCLNYYIDTSVVKDSDSTNAFDAEEGYKSKSFDSCGYDTSIDKKGKPLEHVLKDDDEKGYFNNMEHYYYCNNVMSMCLKAFVNDSGNDSGEVYSSIIDESKVDLSKIKKISDSDSNDDSNSSESDSDDKDSQSDEDTELSKIMSEYDFSSLSDAIDETKKEKNLKNALNNIAGGLAQKTITDRIPTTQEGYSPTKYDSLKDNQKTNVTFDEELYEKDDKDDTKVTKYINKKGEFINPIVEKVISQSTEYTNSNGGSVSGDGSDIVELAKEQVGKTGDNYWNHTDAWKNGPADWCAIFCAWLIEQVGAEPSSVGWAASCSAWHTSAAQKKIWHDRTSSYKPKAGDFIIFNHGHVGIVIDFKDGKISTVEGNSGNYNEAGYLKSTVAQHDNSYTLSTADVAGFVETNFPSSTGGSGKKTSLKDACTQKSYKGRVVKLTSNQRKHIEILCYNEHGCDYNGCALIAQCIRDAIADGDATADNIKTAQKYQASNTVINGGLSDVPSYCKKAVKEIFNGGYVVKHHVRYMYAPKYCKSAWHETLHLVIEYKGVRYFDVKDAKH